jgi:putative hydrolase of the HAD superfamily
MAPSQTITTLFVDVGKEFVDCFFVHARKPEPAIYRRALDIAQVKPTEVVYVDDQALFVEVAERLGMHGIHHTSYDTTLAAPAVFGLSLTEEGRR